VQAKLHRWVQRHGWDRAATCYERFWGEQLRPVVDLLLAIADPQPGEHVLDVAAGTGAVTLDAATAVGPAGRVVATDISAKMLEELRRHAAARECSNVDVVCAGAEDLDVGVAFDVAVCSLGLMYVPSPPDAAAALHRSLRPGGRTAVSVWGERRNCGWAEIFPIVEERVSSDVCPMFFALGAPGALTATLERAGFVDVTETRLAVELRYADDEEALGAAFDGGPVALAASRFSTDDRAAAHAAYLSSIAAYADGSGYRVPGEFVVGSGQRRTEPVDHRPDPAPIQRPTSKPLTGATT